MRRWAALLMLLKSFLIEVFMDKKFYIDESGNTGDLVVTEEDADLSSQEYFTLGQPGEA